MHASSASAETHSSVATLHLRLALSSVVYPKMAIYERSIEQNGASATCARVESSTSV
jgi:hypothetical protein